MSSVPLRRMPIADQAVPLHALRETALAFAARAAARAPDLDRAGAFPANDVADLHRSGLLAAPLALVGYGAPADREAPLALLDLLRLVGRGSLPVGRLYEGHVNALTLIARYGTPAQRARFARDAEAGRLFGVWNTEPAGAGLTLDGRQLSGRKSFASGAGFVERPLVTARTAAGELLMLVVDLPSGERADISEWQVQGMRASATGIVDFTGLPVGPEAILGGPGDYHGQPLFSGGAWRFAAVQLGGVEAVAEAARDHLRRTGRGEDPHQLARLGQIAGAVETARLWVESAAIAASEGALAASAGAASVDQGEADRVVAYVNLARLAVERAGLDVLELATRSVGLQGFLESHPLERLGRDLATYLRQPAPDRALTEAARHVLASPSPFGDLWREG